MRDMNFMVCKIGTTNGTDTYGDMMIIPFKQDEGISGDNLAGFYKPGREKNSGSSGFWSSDTLQVAACVSTNKGFASAQVSNDATAYKYAFVAGND